MRPYIIIILAICNLILVVLFVLMGTKLSQSHQISREALKTAERALAVSDTWEKIAKDALNSARYKLPTPCRIIVEDWKG